MTPIDVATSLANLKLERDAIVLYDALATIERERRRAEAFQTIVANERRHAEIWASKLRTLGAAVPPPDPPRLRIRFIILMARLLGTQAVRDLVLALESDEEALYAAQGTPEIAAIAADEREHVEIWRRLAGDRSVWVAGDSEAAAAERSGRPSNGVSAHWQRAGRSGTLRAIIFGVSDGLVSNLALVMGVAGAAAGAASSDGGFVLLAGIAGLLAGAFSMGAGEYISMQSQRELFERQIALERAEMQAVPDQSETELANVYRAKGFTDDEATMIAHRMFGDPERALDTLVREELGLDPDELGSAWGAAIGSFIAFGIGAVIPVIPYFVASGAGPFFASILLSLVSLFAVGAGVSLLTGRSTLYSGARQVAIGGAAAAVTYLVGTALGVGVAG